MNGYIFTLIVSVYTLVGLAVYGYHQAIQNHVMATNTIECTEMYLSEIRKMNIDAYDPFMTIPDLDLKSCVLYVSLNRSSDPITRGIFWPVYLSGTAAVKMFEPVEE